MKVQFQKDAIITRAEQKQRSRKARVNHARCNICDRVFRAASSFHRFCKSCKDGDELFRFHEWLPQT